MCFVDAACIHQADYDLMITRDSIHRRFPIGVEAASDFVEPCLPVQIVVRDSAHVILTSFEMCSACSSLKDMFRDGIPSHHSFSEVFELAVFKKINFQSEWQSSAGSRLL